jgi:hypothetical protein
MGGNTQTTASLKKSIMADLKIAISYPSPAETDDVEIPSPSSLRELRAVMASAISPADQYGNPSGGSGYGSGLSENGKSPLSMSLGFLKNLTEKKTTRGRLARHRFH